VQPFSPHAPALLLLFRRAWLGHLAMLTATQNSLRDNFN